MVDPKEMLATLVDRFAVTAKVQNVFGEPIESHGKTIIPVARVSYRLGAGGGSGEKRQDSAGVRSRGRRRRRRGSGRSCRGGRDHGSGSPLCAFLRSPDGCRIGRRRDCVRPAVAKAIWRKVSPLLAERISRPHQRRVVTWRSRCGYLFSAFELFLWSNACSFCCGAGGCDVVRGSVGSCVER